MEIRKILTSISLSRILPSHHHHPDTSYIGDVIICRIRVVLWYPRVGMQLYLRNGPYISPFEGNLKSSLHLFSLFSSSHHLFSLSFLFFFFSSSFFLLHGTKYFCFLVHKYIMATPNNSQIYILFISESGLLQAEISYSIFYAERVFVSLDQGFHVWINLYCHGVELYCMNMTTLLIMQVVGGRAEFSEVKVLYRQPSRYSLHTVSPLGIQG